MNCATHADIPSEVFCTQCGRALCKDCIRQVRESVYCENCLDASIRSDAKPGVKPAGSETQFIGGDNPEAAFVLGLIPGVGAIYNGDYFKAAVHVLIFGLLTSLGAALLAVAFYFYMPFEAYYTAKKRKLSAKGIQVVTPIDRFYEQMQEHTGPVRNRELWGGIGLIVLGSLYLMITFDVISFEGARRFWPALLILAGVALLVRAKSREKNT